jgi:hypothetical protein
MRGRIGKAFKGTAGIPFLKTIHARAAQSRYTLVPCEKHSLAYILKSGVACHRLYISIFSRTITESRNSLISLTMLSAVSRRQVNLRTNPELRDAERVQETDELPALKRRARHVGRDDLNAHSCERGFEYVFIRPSSPTICGRTDRIGRSALGQHRRAKCRKTWASNS